MLSRLRVHFSTAGLVVAIAALVAALAGGAVAANSGSNDGQAAASAKGKKGPRGPKGPKGDPGPQGAAGPAGPQGAKGDTGAAGSNGTNGTNGATGATGNKGTTGATGATGATGPTGETGFTATLPSGESLYGHWAVGMTGPDEGFVATPISFGIPYSTEEAPAFNYVKFGTADPDCPGNSGEPAAALGNLCVFESEPQFPAATLSEEGTLANLDKNGVMLLFTPFSSTPGVSTPTLMAGSWAVTAE